LIFFPDILAYGIFFFFLQSFIRPTHAVKKSKLKSCRLWNVHGCYQSLLLVVTGIEGTNCKRTQTEACGPLFPWWPRWWLEFVVPTKILQ
jgi:hypothetical protein